MTGPYRGNPHLPCEGVKRIYDHYGVRYGAHPRTKRACLLRAKAENFPLYLAYTQEVNQEIEQLELDANHYKGTG